VIEPHVPELTAVFSQKTLHREIYINMISVFGETPFLKNILSNFSPILKSDQVSTLVKFAEAIHNMGAKVFQCIPHLACALHSSSPLLRPLIGFLGRYTLIMSEDLASTLFRTQTIVKMLNHKDALVRRVGIQLMGKKCQTNSRNLQLLFPMWEDKNSKVRKEIIDVFCDFGKRDSNNLSLIIANSFLEKISSVDIWQMLSYAWQGFLHSPSTISKQDSSSHSDEAS